MANRQIHDGDIVWINPDRPPRLGRPVAAEAWDIDDQYLGMVIKVWASRDGIEALWSDSDVDGRNPTLCRRFKILGPVVMITPKSYPPP
jgi:hypothetical protein